MAIMLASLSNGWGAVFSRRKARAVRSSIYNDIISDPGGSWHVRYRT